MSLPMDMSAPLEQAEQKFQPFFLTKFTKSLSASETAIAYLANPEVTPETIRKIHLKQIDELINAFESAEGDLSWLKSLVNVSKIKADIKSQGAVLMIKLKDVI